MVDEEELMARVAELMSEVRFTPPGATEPMAFRKTSRRVRLWTEVPDREKPACFQAEHGNQEDQTTNLPYKSVVNINWIIYQSAGKIKDAIPAQWNNAILKGVRAALRPKPGDPGFRDKRNTLGGLVHHLYISGRVFKDPGDIDSEGMMVVPIKVLVPSLA